MHTPYFENVDILKHPRDEINVINPDPVLVLGLRHISYNIFQYLSIQSSRDNYYYYNGRERYLAALHLSDGFKTSCFTQQVGPIDH